MTAVALGGKAQESADARKLTRRGRSAEPLPSPLGEERAQVGRGKPKQGGRRDFLAPILPEEADEAVRGRDIGATGVGRPAAIVLQV